MLLWIGSFIMRGQNARYDLIFSLTIQGNGQKSNHELDPGIYSWINVVARQQEKHIG